MVLGRRLGLCEKAQELQLLGLGVVPTSKGQHQGIPGALPPPIMPIGGPLGAGGGLPPPMPAGGGPPAIPPIPAGAGAGPVGLTSAGAGAAPPLGRSATFGGLISGYWL